MEPRRALQPEFLNWESAKRLRSPIARRQRARFRRIDVTLLADLRMRTELTEDGERGFESSFLQHFELNDFEIVPNLLDRDSRRVSGRIGLRKPGPRLCTLFCLQHEE